MRDPNWTLGARHGAQRDRQHPRRAGVLGNDTDANGDALTAALVSGPAHAAGFILNPDGSFIYVPAANFNGADSFTYRASDGFARSGATAVAIAVAPVDEAVPPAPKPAPKKLETLTFSLSGRSRQLIVDKRSVSVLVGCGGVPCKLTIDGRGSARGRALFRLRRKQATLPGTRRRHVHIPTTLAQRRAIRRALGRRSANGRLTFKVTARDSGGKKITRRFVVKLRRVKR